MDYREEPGEFSGHGELFFSLVHFLAEIIAISIFNTALVFCNILIFMFEFNCIGKH